MMITPQDVGAWAGAGAAAVLAAFAVWRKNSRDLTHLASDREERVRITDGAEALRQERERANEAVRRERETWDVHIKDAEDIARLTAENLTLRSIVSDMERRVHSLQRIVWAMATEQQRKMLGSDFGELDERSAQRPPTTGEDG